MGWFGGSAKVSTVQEVPEKKFLEDLPPKFEDKEEAPVREPTLVDAMHNIKLSDYSVERFVGMPCFREAMITGFQAMGVLGVVTFLIHKNPSKLMNWSVCGFFLGNVVGWEQCRLMRARLFQLMEKAKKVKQEKNMQKWNEKGENDEDYEKFKEFNEKR